MKDQGVNAEITVPLAGGIDCTNVTASVPEIRLPPQEDEEENARNYLSLAVGGSPHWLMAVKWLWQL